MKVFSVPKLSARTLQFRSALLMSLSVIAIGFAVNVHADDASTSESSSESSSASSDESSEAPPKRPDHAKFEAARKACESSVGVAKGTRPTEAQHAAMDKCMKAAGFERPPGPPGGHGRPPGPPPEDSSGDSSGSSSSGSSSSSSSAE